MVQQARSKPTPEFERWAEAQRVASSIAALDIVLSKQAKRAIGEEKRQLVQYMNKTQEMGRIAGTMVQVFQLELDKAYARYKELRQEPLQGPFDQCLMRLVSEPPENQSILKIPLLQEARTAFKMSLADAETTPVCSDTEAAKWERCVQEIKAKGDERVNPFAVCTASIGCHPAKDEKAGANGKLDYLVKDADPSNAAQAAADAAFEREVAELVAETLKEHIR